MTDAPTEAMIQAVTQADRDAASELITQTWSFPQQPAMDTRMGRRDDSPTVQAFAKHRLAAMEASRPPSGLVEDKARLDWLESECADIRWTSLPTGGGDADVGCQVVGHFMGEPSERVFAEVYEQDVRKAIDEARREVAEHGVYSERFPALSQAAPVGGDANLRAENEQLRDDMREALHRQLQACFNISRASPFWDDRMREGADAVIDNLIQLFDLPSLATLSPTMETENNDH